MKNFMAFLTAVYNNLPLILTIIAILFGIGVKVRNFLMQSSEEKKAQLKEQADKVVELAKEGLLSLVSKAEKEWGSGTGVIKKAWVWEQLQAQYDKLTDYIATGLIDQKVIDDLIETAVDELNELLKKNDNVVKAVEAVPTVVVEAVPKEVKE